MSLKPGDIVVYGDPAINWVSKAYGIISAEEYNGLIEAKVVPMIMRLKSRKKVSR